jgi:hypothetical protein
MNQKLVSTGALAIALALVVACQEDPANDETAADGEGGSGAEAGAGAAGGAGGGVAGEGGEGGGEGGEGGGMPELPSWGEEDPGVSVGPFGEFKLFRSGCGEQLWGRWIPREDFALGVQTIHHPGGGSSQTTYFETPVFLTDEKTVFLFGDQGGFGDGIYDLELKVGYANDAVLTHFITAPSEPLFRWPGQFDLVSAFNNSSGELQVGLTPHISGSIGRAFLYDADSECKVAGIQYLSVIPIHDGVSTEINVRAQGLTPGAPYTLVLQGVDDARDYVFYATLELTGP